MVLRPRAFVLSRRLMEGAMLAGVLVGCTPPARLAPPPPAPPVAASMPVAVSPPPASPVRLADFHERSIIAYQTDDVFRSRLADSHAAFASYIRHVERRVAAALDNAPPVKGFSAAIVIALKPGGASHAWLVTRAKLPPGYAAPLIAAAQSVPPVAVQGGPVAFAIVFEAFGGGGPPVVDAAHPVPIPREWHDRNLSSPAPLSQ